MHNGRRETTAWKRNALLTTKSPYCCVTLWWRHIATAQKTYI